MSEIERLVADYQQVSRERDILRESLQWIADDARYKPPEEHNWLSTRYVDRARFALEKVKE